MGCTAEQDTRAWAVSAQPRAVKSRASEGIPICRWRCKSPSGLIKILKTLKIGLDRDGSDNSSLLPALRHAAKAAASVRVGRFMRRADMTRRADAGVQTCRAYAGELTRAC